MKRNDTAIIMYYWNHFKRKSILKNFYICHNNLQKYDCDIIPIEISTNDYFDLEIGNTIKFKNDQLLWQKERIINLVVKKIQSAYEYVAFVDGDILLSEDLWIEQAKEKLNAKDNLMVQLFSDVYYLPRGHYRNHGYYSFSTPSVASQIVNAGSVSAYADSLNSDDYIYGNPGMGWITKTQTLVDNPLYDKCIVGGGDTINLIYNLGIENKKDSPIGRAMANDIDCFLTDKTFTKNTNVEFDFVDQPIFHLNHGNRVNRKYIERQSILSECNFLPSEDLYIDQGIYRYKGNNALFLKKIETYFKERNEDLE